MEAQRLQIERDRLGIEKLTAWVTPLSLLIPLIIAILTLRSQAKSARELKEAEARSAFELKAAELVLGAYSPSAASGRARVLESLFKDRLPPGFAGSFPKKDVPGLRVHEMKLELLRELAENPEHTEKILSAWRQTFPEEEWLQPITVPSAPPSGAGAQPREKA